MKNINFKQVPENKIPFANTKFFIRHSASEVLELHFQKQNVKHYILTIVCNDHEKTCQCGFNRWMKLTNNSKIPHIKEVRDLLNKEEPVISRMLTREINNVISVYGYVNEQDEIDFYNKLKESPGRLNRKKLFKIYGRKINKANECIIEQKLTEHEKETLKDLLLFSE